ncbi:TonB-dependent siderophore receptor [Sphingobium cloacae]|uniref:Fe(3+)-pyochelin receptor 3 n=1 Tax=Sphingobium cloacae TaxID=120107 RepID=A0A1E1EXW6_9SPHN|nr:TonB-dependent siderophore receptor [Sphingobium cloacae]BAV63071.1 Fe(3+)-pyochelin receptor 3 [Sphingobium cloacae]
MTSISNDDTSYPLAASRVTIAENETSATAAANLASNRVSVTAGSGREANAGLTSNQVSYAGVEGAAGAGGGGFAYTSDPAATEGTGTYAAQAVTMFKGAKSLREIPQSVSVMTREQMDDQGFARTEDALRHMAGVRLDGFPDTRNINVRGFRAGEQLDGVPMLATGFSMDPAIYDRLELVRGPSGLLTGSGEPGGSVNYVRKRPLDRFAVAANLAGGSWKNLRAEVDVSGPLSDDGALRGRVVGVLHDRDFYYDVAHERRKLVCGILEYDLTQRDTIAVSALGMENVNNRNWGLPRYSDGTLPGRTAFVGSNAPSPVETQEYIADYRHDFGNDWKSKITYTRRKVDFVQRSVWGDSAVDITTGLGDAYGLYARDINTYSGWDANITGPFALFGRTHTITAGYNWSKNYRNYRAYDMTVFEDVPLLDQHNWGNVLDGSNPGKRFEITKQSGFYASGNFKLLEPLTLVLGGRWTDYSYKVRQLGSSQWVKQPQAANGKFTPYAGLIAELTRQWSLYGSYASIFVPQSVKDYAGNMLDPRTGEQFELGMKGAIIDDKLNVSLAVYQLRDKNRAITDDDPSHICAENWNLLCSKAAGKIQSRGIEAEISGTLAPGLNISASYTYNHTKYLEDSNSANVGKTVEPFKNPKHLFKLWAQYQPGENVLDGALTKWTFGTGLIAQSHIYTDDSGPRYQQAGYVIASAKLGYRFNDHFDAALDVDNLFDHEYIDLLGYDGYYNYWGEPRSFRLTLRAKY